MTAFVVSVFRHGLLSTSYYFLDMELCELNLEDYIERKWTSLIIRKVSYFTNDQPSRMRASQIWDIMQDISSGVAFIHSNKEIHRDLKPRNGRASVCDTILVLYSHTEQAWKIADFGLTVEGTSKKAHTTQYSKGTCSYRAPELIQLDDKGTYTNKVDIWAMGCILYEIVFRSKAFPHDHAVFEYSHEYLDSGAIFDIPTSSETIYGKPRMEFISKIIREMLEVIGGKRPQAKNIRERFIPRTGELSRQESMTNQ
jgi:serine/threonine protein kinase